MFRARETGDSAVMLWAVGRFAGSMVFFDSDPGAGAPGFMLSLASRASVKAAELNRPKKQIGNQSAPDVVSVA